MRLFEIKGNPEEFKQWVQNHVEGWNATASMKKILSSPIAKQYRKPDGKYIYRAWAMSAKNAVELYGDVDWGDEGRIRVPNTAESITLPSKKPYLSFSWTEAGAISRSRDDDFGQHLRRPVIVLTKTELYSPDDILFNLVQYGREEGLKDPTIKQEAEVLLPANEHYLTIAPEEVIRFSPSDPYKNLY